MTGSHTVLLLMKYNMDFRVRSNSHNVCGIYWQRAIKANLMSKVKMY